MEIRFSRSEISSICSMQKCSAIKNRKVQYARKVAIPTEEIVIYILNRAKAGNEMAAVQIDEWCKYCSPSNSREQYILNMLKTAADELFE